MLLGQPLRDVPADDPDVAGRPEVDCFALVDGLPSAPLVRPVLEDHVDRRRRRSPARTDLLLEVQVVDVAAELLLGDVADDVGVGVVADPRVDGDVEVAAVAAGAAAFSSFSLVCSPTEPPNRTRSPRARGSRRRRRGAGLLCRCCTCLLLRLLVVSALCDLCCTTPGRGRMDDRLPWACLAVSRSISAPEPAQPSRCLAFVRGLGPARSPAPRRSGRSSCRAARSRTRRRCPCPESALREAVHHVVAEAPAPTRPPMTTMAST